MHVSRFMLLFKKNSFPTDSTLLCLQRPQSYPARGGGHSAHRSPNLVTSLWWLLTSSWLNVLLVFVPLGFLAEHLHWGAAAIFSLNFLAIIPLAKVSPPILLLCTS